MASFIFVWKLSLVVFPFIFFSVEEYFEFDGDFNLFSAVDVSYILNLSQMTVTFIQWANGVIDGLPLSRRGLCLPENHHGTLSH